jgi:hypothetical protein
MRGREGKTTDDERDELTKTNKTARAMFREQLEIAWLALAWELSNVNTEVHNLIMTACSLSTLLIFNGFID